MRYIICLLILIHILVIPFVTSTDYSFYAGPAPESSFSVGPKPESSFSAGPKQESSFSIGAKPELLLI